MIACPCEATCSLHFAWKTHSRLVPKPHSKLLPTTAGPPSDTEALQLLTEIQGAESEMATMAPHIARLQAALDELQLRHEKLQHFADTHKAVLSAMRRFPNEILHEIFAQSATDSDSTPWAASQVCSHWRAVAVSSPRLWCRFILPNTFPKALPLQLRRAARAPLRINFGYDTPSSTVLTLLLPVSSRWEVITIDVEAFMSPRFFPYTFPALKTLTLVVDDEFDEDVENEDYVDMLHSLPFLSELGLFFTPDATFPRTLLLPWAQLRRCDMTSPGLLDTIWILGQFSPNTAVSACTIQDDFIADVRITNTLVTSLTLIDCDEDTLNILFAHLTAPALTIFRIRYREGHAESLSGQHIRRFLERSECALIRLRLDGTLDTDEFAQILESPYIRGLHRLHVSATTLSTRALAALELPLPALNALILCRTGLDNASVEAALATNRPVGAMAPRVLLVEPEA
ncbi:hypothetical protein C8R46DRAFT_1082098 [Mycena filopes]|nr:hypothetical protein C8R46DRAFT_1082098 [Mycena filopes]